MRRVLPILVALLGLATVTATVLVLFSDEQEPGVKSFIGKENNREQQVKTVANAAIDPDPADEGAEHRAGVPEVSTEKLLPDRKLLPFQGDLTIRVLRLSGREPVPDKNVALLRLFYNGLQIDQVPKPTHKTGEYILSNILPGHYKVTAASTDWERGKAECTVDPGTETKVSVLLSSPGHLQLQIMDSLLGSPVRSASIRAYGFITGGTTDNNGLFKSTEKFFPEPDMLLEISHPGYLTTLLDPFNPERSGASRIGNSQSIRVPLMPRSGELSIEGIIVDDQEAPLAGWALTLMSMDAARPQNTYFSLFSSRSGAFSFDKLRPGRYRLTGTLNLLKRPYVANPPMLIAEEFTLVPGQSLIGQVIRCNRVRIHFSGRVRVTDTHLPADGAVVSYRSPLRGRSGMQDDALGFEPIKTGPTGAFTSERQYLPEDIFHMLNNGSIKIQWGKGDAVTFRPIQNSTLIRRLLADLVTGKGVILWAVSKTGIRLSGRVVDASGVPAVHARINAETYANCFMGHHGTRTDTNGFFELTDLYPADWVIKATVPGGRTEHRTVKIPADEKIKPLTMVLEGKCALQGSLTAVEKVTNLTIRVQGIDYEVESRISGKELLYSFTGLPRGKALVTVKMYEGNRYQDSAMKVLESWVELEPGQPLIKNFQF